MKLSCRSASRSLAFSSSTSALSSWMCASLRPSSSSAASSRALRSSRSASSAAWSSARTYRSMCPASSSTSRRSSSIFSFIHSASFSLYSICVSMSVLASPRRSSSLLISASCTSALSRRSSVPASRSFMRRACSAVFSSISRPFSSRSASSRASRSRTLAMEMATALGSPSAGSSASWSLSVSRSVASASRRRRSWRSRPRDRPWLMTGKLRAMRAVASVRSVVALSSHSPCRTHPTTSASALPPSASASRRVRMDSS
mmetsp:Transcript_27948/g.71267  ORF Transcript_27948/g.71267 Transcript_27948/m.71267 type:complete len:259 (+) Transcript_27948:963-1739(+)